MTTITELMSHNHRDCDALFALAERAVNEGRWDAAAAAFRRFAAALEGHLGAEEEVLFPRFEAVTGMTGGPTQMMRMEHADMREVLQQLHGALAEQDGAAYAGEAETLLILMQQHNMKEENILYPMCDGQLGSEAAELAQRIGARLRVEQDA